MLTLTRTTKGPAATLGQLRLGPTIICVTLENTALIIPAGIFMVTLDYSPHFQMLLPRLHDVPGRSDIEIHPANEPKDLRGCIGVGRYAVGSDAVAESRLALGVLLAQWRAWYDGSIEVRDSPVSALA